MLNPRSMSPGSLMPPYPWLIENSLSTKNTKGKIKVMQKLGVPYSDEYKANAVEYLTMQAQEIAEELSKDPNIEVMADKEIIALIAYLQRVGTDIKGSDGVWLGPEDPTMPKSMSELK